MTVSAAAIPANISSKITPKAPFKLSAQLTSPNFIMSKKRKLKNAQIQTYVISQRYEGLINN